MILNDQKQSCYAECSEASEMYSLRGVPGGRQTIVQYVGVDVSTVRPCDGTFFNLHRTEKMCFYRQNFPSMLYSSYQNTMWGIGMAKIWDSLMKLLVGANQQHLVTLLLPGAQYLNELNTDLRSKVLQADILYTIKWSGRKVILHVEFQKRRDKNMARRLWAYNSQIAINTNLPVCSFVIYLKRDGNVAQSPYEIELPDDEVVHRFSFRTIKLWEISTTAFKQTGLEGLLPLLPLAKNGSSREIVEDMIQGLNAAEKNDLLPLGYAFASMILKTVEDKNWLKERFSMLRDIFEDSWAYKEMVAQGLQQGLEQGIQKGEVQGLREAVIIIVEGRFPNLADLAKKQMNLLEDTAALRRLIVKMSNTRSAQLAEKTLRAISSGTKKR